MALIASQNESKWARKGKQFFITWPQCPLSKESVEFTLRERFNDAIEYMVVSQEEHKQTSGLHLHCFILFKETRRVKGEDFTIQVVQTTYVAHIEGVRSIKATIKYTKKDGNFVEFGKSPIIKKEEERRDKLRFMTEHNINTIMESGMFSLSEIRNAIFIKSEIEKSKFTWPSYKKRIVYWYWGPTGTGKTRTAVRDAELLHTKWTIISGDLKTFMNGYNGEESVIIDDIRKGTMRFEQLLRILDGYRLIVNVKGGQKEWLAERIWITCPQPPHHLFRNEETLEPWDNIDQLLRRIDTVREFEQQEPTEVLPILPALDLESEALSPIPQLPEAEGQLP